MCIYIFQGTSNNKEEKSYNNAFEMMPAFGMLHKGASGFMNTVTLSNAQEIAKKEGHDNKAYPNLDEVKD